MRGGGYGSPGVLETGRQNEVCTPGAEELWTGK